MLVKVLTDTYSMYSLVLFTSVLEKCWCILSLVYFYTRSEQHLGIHSAVETLVDTCVNDSLERHFKQIILDRTLSSLFHTMYPVCATILIEINNT